MKEAARPRRKNHLPRLVPVEAVNDTDSMLAAYDEQMRGAAGFVAEEPETVLIGLAWQTKTQTLTLRSPTPAVTALRALSVLDADTAVASQAADRIHLRRTG